MKRLALIAAASLLAACFQSVGREDTKPSAKPTAVKGIVFDGAKKPLAGVAVILSPHSRKDSTSRCTSDKSGEYDLKGVVTSPFNVSFQMTDYRPCVLENLHERGPHTVNVAMYKVKDAMPASAAQQYLNGVRAIVFQSLSLPKPGRAKFLASFNEEGSGEGGKHYLGVIDKIQLDEKVSGDVSDFLLSEQAHIKHQIERATGDVKGK